MEKTKVSFAVCLLRQKVGSATWPAHSYPPIQAWASDGDSLPFAESTEWMTCYRGSGELRLPRKENVLKEAQNLPEQSSDLSP